MRYIKERKQKRWLDANAQQVLTDIGASAAQVLVDFGCSGGTYTIPAARLVGQTGTVYALDKNSRALKKLRRKAARQGLRNIQTMVQNETPKIPLPASSCDVMLLYDVLQLIQDWALLFDEAHRILKPSGILSVYPMHIDMEEMKRYIDDAGFTSTGEIHGILNFSKRGIE